MGPFERLLEDVRVVFDRDPAARSTLEIALAYPGVHALVGYRVAHWLWLRGLCLPARLLSNLTRFLTGVDIHPGATIGRRVFIDHGMGVVIGETAEIGNDVTLYQGVTLGGTSLKKEKRHPTVEDCVLLSSGAIVLGPVTIGANSRIGAGSVVIHSVPPNSTVVGIPGRVVRGDGVHHPAAGRLELIDLDHGDLPDPVARAISVLVNHVEKLEKRLEEVAERQGAQDERRLEEDEDLRRVKAFLSEG
jgi:serine O-acetyltransferase